MSLTNKGNKKMKNKKITAIAGSVMGNTLMHVHGTGCNDLNQPKYKIQKNCGWLTDVSIIKSPFAEYSDLEFTILERKTRCGVKGDADMELCTGDPIVMIEPNVYILDVPKDEDEEFYSCAYGENGEQIKYDLEGISKISYRVHWEEVKVFPCAKK